MLAKFIKRAAGFFVGLGLFMCALIVSVSLALNTHDARQMILDKINHGIPGTLSMDHLAVSLFAGSLEAYGFRLTGPDNEPLINIRRLSVNLSWTSLFFRSLFFESIHVEEPQIFLGTDGNNRLNLVRAFTQEGGGTPTPENDDKGFPFNIKVGSLDISGGELVYAMEDKERIHAEHIVMNASRLNLLRRSGAMTMELGPCRLSWDDRAVQIVHMDLSGKLKRKKLSSLILNLTSDLGNLSINGEVNTPFKQPELDLFITWFHNDLSEMDKALALALGLSGEARIDLHVWGDYDNPQGDMAISAHHARLFDYRVNTFDAKVRVLDRLVTLTAVDLDTGIGHGALTGTLDLKKACQTGYVSSPFKSDQVAYSLDLSLRDTILRAIPYVDGIADGQAQADIHLKGHGLWPDEIKAMADVAADSQSLSFLGTPHAEYYLKGRVSYTKGQLKTTDATLTTGDTHVALNGEYRLDNGTFQGDLDLLSEDLSSLAFITPYGEYSGKADVKTHWAHNGETWMGRFAGQGSSIAVNSVGVGDLSLQAVLEKPGILTVSSCDAASKDFRFHGKGRMGLFDDDNRLDLSVDVTGADISRLLKWDQVNGLAEGHVTVTGTLFSPKLESTVTGHDLAWKDIRLGSLSTAASYENGKVSWTGMTLKNKRSLIQSRGWLSLLDKKTFSLLLEPSGEIELKSSGLDVEDFYSGISGHATVDTQVKGRPGDLAGHIRLNVDALKVMDQVFDHVAVSSHASGEDLVVDQAVVSFSPGEDMRLSGFLSLNDFKYSLKAASDPISIKRLHVLGPQSPCQGKVVLDLSGTGTFDNPGLQGSIALHDVYVNRESLDGGVLNIEVADHVARMHGKLIADIDSRIHLDTFDFMAQAGFDRTVLNPFFRIGGYADFEGNMSGNIKAWGRLTEPDLIRAQADVSSVSVQSEGKELIRGGPVRFTYGGKFFALSETRLVLLDKGSLTVQGQGNIDGKLSVSVKGAIPLELMEPFAEELVNLEGLVGVSVQVAGTVASPEFYGDLTLDSVSFLIPEVMQQVHDVNGRLHATADQVTLESLTGGLDTGRFNIRGTLALDRFKPGAVALSISGESLPFSLPDTLDMTVNTSMTFTGTPSETFLEGTVMLIEGKYYKDAAMNLISMVTGKTRKDNPENEPTDIPYLKGLVLNVNLKHRNPFDVDNNIAYLELKPDLKLYGTLNHPLISGRAQVMEDGVITYQGKEFEVVKGVVDFLNPYKIEPTLDVQCETVIRDWTITLSVAGTPENLKFTLTSNPSEADGDIISILLFGKTTAELRAGGGKSSVSAAQLLSDVIGRRLEKNIKDATGIDIVEVEYSNANSKTSENGVKVTIGKELSERLTVKYGMENKNAETVQRAISEYKFMENLMINAYQDSANDYGAELVYRLEFR